MEVDHDGHVHEDKKWKEYVFQFLMLFFAVFCSFLAEIQVEHSIEAYREKQFIKGMLNDLKSDTTDLNSSIAFAERLKTGLDTLKHTLEDKESITTNAQEIYRLNSMYCRRPALRFSDQTAIQLRNAGGMRLIRKPEVVKGISFYWDALNAIKEVEGGLDDRLNEDTEYGFDLFDRRYIHSFGVDTCNMSIVEIDKDAQMMTTDPVKITNYTNRIARRVDAMDAFFIRNLKLQKERAIDLMKLIRDEYKVE